MDKDLDFISINDFLGKIENGVAVDLSIKINEKIYHLMYWFDKNDNYKMSADKNFLDDFKINSIYEYKNYKKLAYYIHNFIITDKEELFEKFLI